MPVAAGSGPIDAAGSEAAAAVVGCHSPDASRAGWGGMNARNWSSFRSNGRVSVGSTASASLKTSSSSSPISSSRSISARAT